MPSSRKDRSRALIRDAADAAFREKPFDDVSMEEIARRAGLTRKTLYNLFASKEEIAYAIIILSELYGGARYRARMAAGEPALRLLDDALNDSARWCLDNPSIAPLALAGPPEGLAMTPPPGRDSFQALVVDMITLGQEQGVLRRDRPAFVLASILLGSFANVMRFALAGGPFEVAWISGLLNLTIEGIGAREAPRPKRKGQKT